MSSSRSSFSSISSCNLEFVSPRCLCKPAKLAKLKVSSTGRNPRKAFFKCNDCGFFKWLYETDIKGIENSKVADDSASEQLTEEIASVKNQVMELGSYLREVVRIGLFLYVVLVVIVMLKAVVN